MALLDGLPNLRNVFPFFGNTPPAPDPASTKPPVDGPPQGRSGRANFDGFVQWDEFNAEWIGNNGLKLADMMWRTDADIKRDTLATWSPITSATWDIDPYGGDQASEKDLYAAALCKYALWDFMRPNLLTHLAELGPILIRSGFTDFEQIWKTTTYKGKNVMLPKKLDLRLPRTIWRFYQDDDGELTGVVQLLPNASNVWIPASELLHYRLQAEGDNWTGTSMYRHAWKHFYFKEKLERIDAIGQERKAVGLPVVYPPDGAPEETKEEMEVILANVHTNEVGFVIMPGPKAGPEVDPSIGWDMEIKTFDSGSGSGIRESIDQQTLKIAGAFIADFLELGHHQVGARATAQVQEDPFMTAIKALSELILDPLNELCARIATLNVPGLEGTPKLSMSLHDEASLSELSTYAQQLYMAEMLTPDPQTEDFFRERADMPPADPEIRKEHQEAQKAGRQLTIKGIEPGGEEGAPAATAEGGKYNQGARGSKIKRGPGKPGDGERGIKPGAKSEAGKSTGSPSGKSLELEAAAGAPNGVMVALYPSDEVAGKLALPDGEPASSLHVTLAYLGKANTLTDHERLRTVVAGWAAATPPIDGRTSGMGVFAPGANADGEPVTYASVDAPRLSHYRESLVHSLKHAGFDVGDEHGFTPHITLDYAERNEAEGTVQPLHFDHVTLAIADVQQQIPLTGASVVTLDGEVGTAPWYEELLSQGRLKEALDNARESMEAATKPAAIKLAAVMAARARSGRKISVAAPPADLLAAFEKEMTRLYELGHQTVIDELAQQHSAMGTRPIMLDAEEPEDEGQEEAIAPVPVKGRRRLKRRASIAAEHVTNEVAREAERAALAGERSPLTLQRQAENAAINAIRREALTNASPSINDGRRDAATVAIGLLAAKAVSGATERAVTGRTTAQEPQQVRGIYTSVLDNRTCGYCEGADDGVEREPEDPALQVPNPECDGGEYCRCMVVWVLDGAKEALVE